MKKIFTPAQKVFLVYFLLILLLRILVRLKFLSFWLLLDNFYLFLGMVFGWFLLKADRVVHAFFIEPQTQLSYHIRYLVKNLKPLKLLKLLKERKAEQKNLVFRSAVFQVVWLALAFFTLTSTTSFFGKGMILGLGLHLLFDEGKDLRYKGVSFVRDWLFWQVKREVTLKETKIFLGVMTGGFVILSWLII